MNLKRHSATARVTTSLANMDGPQTVGRAGWINPFGFFILDRHFLPTHLPLTQPCKAGIPLRWRVNHTRARERGLCSARKDHARDCTWSSDREQDDLCWTIGLSVVRCRQGRFKPFPQCRPTPALDGRGVGQTHVAGSTLREVEKREREKAKNQTR